MTFQIALFYLTLHLWASSILFYVLLWLVCLYYIIFVTFHFTTLSHNLLILQLMDTSIVSNSFFFKQCCHKVLGISPLYTWRVSLLEKELLSFREYTPSTLCYQYTVHSMYMRIPFLHMFLSKINDVLSCYPIMIPKTNCDSYFLLTQTSV